MNDTKMVDWYLHRYVYLSREYRKERHSLYMRKAETVLQQLICFLIFLLLVFGFKTLLDGWKYTLLFIFLAAVWAVVSHLILYNHFTNMDAGRKKAKEWQSKLDLFMQKARQERSYSSGVDAFLTALETLKPGVSDSSLLDFLLDDRFVTVPEEGDENV